MTNCSYCKAVSVGVCQSCGKEFCINHRSRFNIRLCDPCANTANLQLQEQPIIDEDGTGHRGRQFKLIGEGWPHSLSVIAKMTDDELMEYINELTRRLADAQLTLDYTRILRSAAVFQQDFTKYSRSNAARKRRENIEVAHLTKGKLTTGGRRKKAPKETSRVKMLMKALNITYDEAVSMETLLDKLAKKP